MALQITENCINCGNCVSECPNHAIYECGIKWNMAKGTKLKGSFTLADGRTVDAGEFNKPLSFDTSYIVPGKCTECRGFFDEPQCVKTCEVNAIVQSAKYAETIEQLLSKKAALHAEA